MDLRPQALFDAAYIGVMDQGRAAVGAAGNCVWLTHDRKERCAVSHAAITCAGLDISDDEKRLEWRLLLRTSPDTKTFVSELMLVHDGASAETHSDAEFITEYDRAMKVLARKHGLTIPEIK